jgi:hypothetical protein
VQEVGSCIDWEQFEERFGEDLKLMPFNDTAWLFKAGIRPAWEDEANCGSGAGRWVVPTSDRACSTAVMAELVKAMDGNDNNLGHLNGIVLTKKFGQNMVLVWTGATTKEERASLHQTLRSVLSDVDGAELSTLNRRSHTGCGPGA